MQQTFRIKILVSKGGKLSIKGLPFRAGESVEVTIRRKKKLTTRAKYPMRGKPFIYRQPFNAVALSDWEAMR